MTSVAGSVAGAIRLLAHRQFCGREFTSANPKARDQGIGEPAIRRLAYWLLISEDDAQWNALMGEASAVADTSKAPQHSTFTHAKSALLRGDGLGERLIRGYVPAMPKS